MHFPFVVVGAGILLSFVGAVVPHYSGAYQLAFGVLVAQLTPYLIYAIIAVLLQRTVTKVAGALMLVGHVLLIAKERFVERADYSDLSIYYLPLLAAALLIPLLVRALRAPWHL